MAKIITTLGGIIVPGLVADLVVDSRGGLELIWLNESDFFRGRELEYEGTLYRLAPIPDGIQHFTRFARGVREYYPERGLLAGLSYLFQSYTQVTEENSKLNAAFTMATWVPEIISGSFTWYVVSPLPAQAMKTVQALCRRPILDSQSWGDSTVRINLLPTPLLPGLSDDTLDEIAATFQPRLERLRLGKLYSQHESGETRCRPGECAQHSVNRQLWEVFGDDPEMPQLLQPVIEHQDEAIGAARSVDLSAVILECLWGPMHAENTISVSEVLKRVNALFFGRGESTVYSAKEVGWRFREMGIERHRTAAGMELRFTGALCTRIHSLAQRFGLKLPLSEGCRLCGTEKDASTSSQTCTL